MNRFRGSKVCNNLATDEIDDHRSESDYKCTDDAALDAAPDPEDLPAVISFSCLSKSLILWPCWCTCTLSCTTSVIRLVICPTNISICPWSPSSRGARSPLIAASIAFASDESCRGGAHRCHRINRSLHHGEGTRRCRSVGLLTQILCTVFPIRGSRDLLFATVLCTFFLCSWCRRVWFQISQGRQFWLFQRRWAGHTLARRSASTTTVSTSIVCPRQYSTNSFFHTRQTSSPSPSTTPSPRINLVVGRGPRVLRWLDRRVVSAFWPSRNYRHISRCNLEHGSEYENSLVLGVNDDLHPGHMRGRNDFLQAAHKLAALHP